ncbi:class I SAM-dependent methyltransferase [Pseudahrensia aquimaris]|uniref:Class I SAM-dependent methyltransferase n=1 Tax=Pseudahrensia aquimaris TaxID=744461 RepID=A0ABW3FFX6_9HYPH
MNKLEENIRLLIAETGPLSVGEYMTLCLTHPTHGYYTTGNPVGGRASAEREGGDFITAPEISQMFGELIGVWVMEVWQALGRPDPFNLVELGPGRGTLMRDLLKAGQAMPGFLPAARITLVEVSPTLGEQQSLTLGRHSGQITWRRDLSELPDRPTIVIANEFLDALPFRQWIKQGDDWLERGVGVVDDALAFVTRSATLPKSEAPQDESLPDGSIFETAPAREGFVASIADTLTPKNGAALFIDYGHLRSKTGDTFQALRDHAHVSTLDAPGESDLTSHVDFEPLAAIAKARGCVVPTPVTQSEFLLSLGLLERAGTLGHGRDSRVQEMLQAAVERLAGPNQMGDLFKVFAFGAPASLGERWPGFV